MTERGSRADRSLIAKLPEDLGVTPRKLERWRQAGLVPEAVPIRPGAVETIYPEGTASQVTELVGILRKDRRLEHALLRLFVRRRWVSERALKSLYCALYKSFADALGPHADGDWQDDESDALAAAENTVERIGWRMSREGLARTIRFRLRRRATRTLSAGQLVNGVFTQALVGLLGGGIYDDSEGLLAAELRAASGAAKAESDDILGQGPLLPHLSDDEVIDMYSRVTLADIIAAVERATLVDLEKARDQWLHIVGLLADFGEVAASGRRRRDVGGMEAIRKVAQSEVLLAIFVPYWLVAEKVIERRYIAGPLWDPTTPEGREYSEQYKLLARLARVSSAPVRPDTFAAALSSAPDDVKQAFEDWLSRSDQRTVLV